MSKITINEITDEKFTALVELSMYDIEVEGDVWTDEIENLWGDQVESISTMAYFDGITSMRVFSKNRGYEAQVITLDLANFVKEELDKFIYEEVDVQDCPVDRSLQYHDLV